MSRQSFLSSLTVGDTVHFIVSDDRRVDAVVADITARRIVIVDASGATVALDSDGYRKGSIVARIEPSNGVAAEDWCADHARGMAVYQARLCERAAA